jgi:hypothetical protein
MRSSEAIVIVALLAGVAHADVSALPCRPTIACTADIVPSGTFELEAGYLYRRLAHDKNQSSVPFLLKLSLTDALQLQVGSNGPTFAPMQSFFDDVVAGLKLRVHRQTERTPSLAVSALVSVPTAEAMGYLRTYDALLAAYVTKDIGWLHADFNVGLNLWRVESEPLTQLWTALALSVPVGRGFGAMVEGYVFSDAAPIAERDAGVLSAISYQPRPWLVIDAGPDVGLVRDTRTVSAFVGVTIDPVALW